MPALWLVVIALALAALGFFLGRSRALATGGGDIRALHSRPGYYGWNVALSSLVPAMGVLLIWMLVQSFVVNSTVAADFPAQAVPEDQTLSLVMSDVGRVAAGLDLAVRRGVISETDAQNLEINGSNIRDLLAQVGKPLASDVTEPVLTAAQEYRALASTGNTLRGVAVLGVALLGFGFAFLRTNSTFRARNVVESGIRTLLVLAACLAVLTTLGIVLSLVFNTIEFFKIYPASEFFLSLTWAPSFGGGSELGIAPLLWGTFYISIIALAVAVPIGLFAAIYLSEYATPKVRAFAKPLIEVLAGIPTIVYGLFALLTVGPLLVSVFGDDGIGIMQAGTAVMTAGFVMGIMLIPFVSSLSDDIINAVPQAMRDGSFGLGATKSETIRQVILPAALPGIVGAILLAASRAIGETMIVVLGAGAAARLSMNPFDAMTTVTAKIVSQLTGDADFASPEALVAFALGMTLFVITLGLNVLALYIVRKYREQYE
ncbi:phosphate ABC transporter permease subunit PstC [Roseovarius rhodophyticola]|uniref:Phosphate transport system permease protein n=1 Tax=Roseovarius rhodophyticola TaxID=3080827 RepID=A0ABZ2TDT0_9RHOB|nr:phosphate ABC transporter permease subunit PstC [Roseovarius sp. W115]MDV2928134.1 phosphate ABC transporter permease subunit PstC [Roseovarius sp. W115]